MDKVSRYVVISDKTYRDDSGLEVRLLYGTRTARLVAVDPDTAESLRTGSPAGVSPLVSAALRAAQIVVPAEQDEMSAVLDRNRLASGDRSSVHIALLPTSYCNMGCSYCGQEHSRGGLTRNHRDQVRARVLRALNAPSTARARIDWFGGEPMMGYAVIRDLAPQFVQVAEELGLDYSSYLVTNGSLLTAGKIDTLIRRCGVTDFEITVDGPPEIHDEHRPLKSGRGSFWSIVRAVREAVDQPDFQSTRFKFRTNVDVHNRDSIPAYIELMAQLGFARPNVSFSIVPVHSWGNDVSESEVAKQDFADRELVWLDLLRRRGLAVQLLPDTPARVLCPATTTSAQIISSTGSIFSCSEYPLVPEAERNLALAHISQPTLEIERPKGPFDDWNDEIEQGKSWCTTCVFMPTCGGSCPKAWHEGHPPCPSYKFNIQGRLDLVAAQSGLRPVPDQVPADR